MSVGKRIGKNNLMKEKKQNKCALEAREIYKYEEIAITWRLIFPNRDSTLQGKNDWDSMWNGLMLDPKSDASNALSALLAKYWFSIEFKVTTNG